MDKLDELAILIAEAPGGSWDNFRPDQQEMFRMAAAAVRSFMGSDEVVDRVALGIKNEGRRFMGFEPIASLSDLEDHKKRDELRIARAALSAAIGEDIGGGRG